MFLKSFPTFAFYLQASLEDDKSSRADEKRAYDISGNTMFMDMCSLGFNITYICWADIFYYLNVPVSMKKLNMLVFHQVLKRTPCLQELQH